MEVKICKNCVHGKREMLFGWEFAKCKATVNPVTGSAAHYCAVERDPVLDSINKCGSTGKLWEAKPPSRFACLWKWLFGYLR